MKITDWPMFSGYNVLTKSYFSYFTVFLFTPFPGFSIRMERFSCATSSFSGRSNPNWQEQALIAQIELSISVEITEAVALNAKVIHGTFLDIFIS